MLHETYGYLYMYETLTHSFGSYPSYPLGIVATKLSLALDNPPLSVHETLIAINMCISF